MNWRTISGDFYDGDRKGVMERSPIHNYDKTLTMKIALSRPDLKKTGESIIISPFATLRKFIRELDRITRGIPKILYLVGWQYEGHDTGYPAFFEVNSKLASEGRNALDELRQIMEESSAFNTTVSVHINMTDAYRDSPLWDEYKRKGLISRKRNGKDLVTGRWYGRKAYQVCYSREWDSGHAVERIDRLLDLLPLQNAGTIHIDAFFCRPDKYRKITIREEQSARRKMVRYFRERGIDVTSEFIYRETGRDDLIGLVPMVWHINQNKDDYIRRPASLLCGGNINTDLRGDKKLNRLFGGSTRGESHFSDSKIQEFNNDWKQPFLEDFFCNTVPWQFLNSLKRLSVHRWSRSALFSEGVVTERKNIITAKGNPMRFKGDLCIPALWSASPLLGVFSKKGGTQLDWVLPDTWKDFNYVKFESVCPHERTAVIPVVKGTIRLNLSAAEGGWITPVSKEKIR